MTWYDIFIHVKRLCGANAFNPSELFSNCVSAAERLHAKAWMRHEVETLAAWWMI
jgi:hypothetical protein